MVTLIQVPRYIALLKNYASKPTLIQWFRHDGEAVEEGRKIVLIETTKASLEIEAMVSGMLFILRKAGEKVKIGDILGIIAETRVEFDEFKDRLLQYTRNQ